MNVNFGRQGGGGGHQGLHWGWGPPPPRKVSSPSKGKFIMWLF